jgi:hypothetical protein
MSVEQLESELLALPPAQRRVFTRWLEEHRDEIERPSVLVMAQRGQDHHRPGEMEADPDLRLPFPEADAETMDCELADARAQNTFRGHP